MFKIGHVYFEGYAHSLWADRAGPTKSMNPRTGSVYEKSVAPPILMAFAEALRRANSAFLDEIVQAFEVATQLETIGDEAILLADLIRRGHSFADLAIQVEYKYVFPLLLYFGAVN